MAADKETKPFNPLDRSPTLVKLLKTRLAPVRERELMAKATCPDRPVKPGPGECCGSSCHPCVMDNYAEELRVWKECWVKWDGGDEKEGETCSQSLAASTEDEKENPTKKMPGSFDW
ncbi:hypothetical protein NKR19_g9588 [Coniochaeta hoffmannii]|uniref:Oxidoreductase-like domain-containing protein n=1 Tax=Coniochaeta hoffmannii TaxID=91930 RepID=A0AA38VJL1_9PEZI|nr:hypothetical protein NKR19_g9588 [Coniochaeta hoffmannii]